MVNRCVSCGRVIEDERRRCAACRAYSALKYNETRAATLASENSHRQGAYDFRTEDELGLARLRRAGDAAVRYMVAICGG